MLFRVEMLTSQSQKLEWAKTGNAKEWRPKMVITNKTNLDIWYGISNYFQSIMQINYFQVCS